MYDPPDLKFLQFNLTPKGSTTFFRCVRSNSNFFVKRNLKVNKRALFHSFRCQPEELGQEIAYKGTHQIKSIGKSDTHEATERLDKTSTRNNSLRLDIKLPT